jgi:hypothetical protein
VPFKPLQANKSKDALVKKETELSAEAKASLKYQSHDEIVASTTERINIIYDDSGSMSSPVSDGAGNYKTCIELAGEATEDFLKNCTPHTTAVEVSPLNAEKLSLTKNLPALAKQVKEIPSSGGTPLYEALEQVVRHQSVDKMTHVVVFTDGQPNGRCPEYLVSDLIELNIPIDIILIGSYNQNQLSLQHQELKNVADKTKGYFLICKDGKAFKDKLKYFAPTLRFMLPQIASEGN